MEGQNAGPPVNNGNAPVNKVTEPVNKVTEPVNKVTEPVKAAEPVNKDTAPVDKAAKPVNKVTAPVNKAAERVNKVTAPVNKAAKPVIKVTAPVNKAAEPVNKVTRPVSKVSAPVITVTEASITIVESADENIAEPVVTVLVPHVSKRVHCPPPMSPQRILKNVAVVSVGSLFLFTAFQSMANLQTSLNKEDGVGAYSLSTIYAALIVSCVFLPKFIIARLGCKWTIVVCMTGYALYIAANFHAVIWLMTLAGMTLGLGAAPMWSAKCAYLTQLSVWYTRLTCQSEDAVITKFFGFFFMVFQSSQIWGNLIASTVLEDEPTARADIRDHGICGSNFVPWKITNHTGFRQPWELVRNLCIIYILCTGLAMVMVAVLLDPIQVGKESSENDRKLSPKLLVATVKHLTSSRHQAMLIPLTVYSGVEQAFIAGDYSQSYISCTLGVSQVGYIFICYGVVDAACSLAFGRLAQYVGHIPLFVIAFIDHLILIFMLLLWIPDPKSPLHYYVMAGLWGMGDAVIQTQTNALYGALFKTNSEAAFANYRLWQSAGFVMTYAYQNSLKTEYKLYICLFFLITGMMGYAVVEYEEKRTESLKSSWS